MAVLSAILLYVPTADSASAGSLTVTDVKELAGTWQGYGRGYFGSGRLPLTWTVAEDGTYSSVGASVTSGKIELANGKLSFDSGFTAGTLTVEERDGKNLMIVEGTNKRNRQSGMAELFKIK